MKSIIRQFLTAFILVSIFFNLAMDDRVMAQTQTQPQTKPQTAGGEQLVSIDFNNVDLVVFIKFMSDLTKKNFIIDDKVKGNVTIISPGKITVSEAYRVFLSVLEVHGYATVPAGKITKIVPTPDARSKSIKTRLKEESGILGDNVVTQLIHLRYADPNEVKKLFTPLVSKSSVILAYPATNTLIVTDVQSNIQRLQSILKAIDITGVGQQIAIIPVEYADATKLVTLLSSVFKKGRKGKGFTDKGITFVADERTNSVVLLASEGDTNNIRKLIKSLDRETPKGQSKINVYYLEHANAEELSKVLQNIPKENAKAKKPGKKTAPVVSDKVRISADKSTNSLIIMADAEDYAVLQNIIKKIDIPRAMVYIEALIMEVSVIKDFNIGTEWIAGGETTIEGKDAVYGGGFSAGGAPAGQAGNLPFPIGDDDSRPNVKFPPGFSMGLLGENIKVGDIIFPTIQSIIQAYKEDSDVNILSTPQILTTDNQEAKIYVGRNIPFQTQTSVNDSGQGLYNSFDYRDVGHTLKITPHISKDRMVRLELSLEVSSIFGTQALTPTTLKRTVDTMAIVQDRNTVVLGGLIDDTMNTKAFKVPCLGDIPLLKYLFSRNSETNNKTNLYIFLTPRVVQSPKESTNISNEKRQHIDQLREENIKMYKYESKPKTQTAPPESNSESYRYQQKTDAADQATSSTKNSKTEVTAGGSTTSSAHESAGQKQSKPVSAKDKDGTAATNGESSYTIEVASAPSSRKADQLLKRLIENGYAAYVVQTEDADAYRVRIGFFDSPESSRQVMNNLKSDQYEPTLIKF